MFPIKGDAKQSRIWRDSFSHHACVMSPSDPSARPRPSKVDPPGGEGADGIAVGAMAGAALAEAAPEAAVQRLARDLNLALRHGDVLVQVPARLAGGNIAFRARAGLVRQQVADALERSLLAGVVDRDQAQTLSVRYGLEGMPGTAAAARSTSGVGPQATSNRVNAAIRALAAELASEPIADLPQPTLSSARREELVLAVLSKVEGPPDLADTRAYVHGRIRADLLGHPMPPLPVATTTGRQQRHREAATWKAVAEDHLDRDRYPRFRGPIVEDAAKLEMETWFKRADRTDVSSLSPRAFELLLLACQKDRRFVQWMGPEGMAAVTWGTVRPTRSAYELMTTAIALLNLPANRHRIALGLLAAQALSWRGMPGIAESLVARFEAQIDLQAKDMSDTERMGFRIATGLVRHQVSFVRGPHHLERTRCWVDRLCQDLAADPSHGIWAPAVGIAITHTEAAAAMARAPTPGSVREALQPLIEVLDEDGRDALSESTCLASHIAALAIALDDREMMEAVLPDLPRGGSAVAAPTRRSHEVVSDEARCGERILWAAWGPPPSWGPTRADVGRALARLR
jgi:hypothetical protein